KNDIRPSPYGLASVMQLRPVAYKHHTSAFVAGTLVLEDSHSPGLGFIAQEVADIIPEAVDRPADESSALWSMDYERIIPVLVAAIQEQQAQLMLQQEEIHQLLGRIEHLESGTSAATDPVD